MKRIVTIFLTILCSFCLFACKEKEVAPVVIDLNEVTVEENAVLLDVMEDLQSRGELTFAIENGMVVAINGTKNATNAYWMLYTSDTDNANDAWGTYEYEGESLGSAVVGAATLEVKTGELYVWVYTKF